VFSKKVSIFFEKVKLFFKKQWYWIAGVLFLIYLVIKFSIGSGKNKSLIEDFSRLNQSRKKDYKDKVDEHQKEIQKRRETIENYDKAIKELEEKYDNKEENLKQREKEQIKKMAEHYEEEPDKFIDELAKKHGLKVIK